MRNLFSRPAFSLGNAGSEDSRRKELGRCGEDAAVKALQKRGYRILDRNYLCRTGEIDIIAEHGGYVVFVEVKTRSPRSWEKPEEAITLEKQARIKRAADYYLAGFKRPSPTRYDAVSVYTSDTGTIDRVEILTNAFGAESFEPIS